MHKYRADGALGSSWHPYVHSDGVAAPPIQEDETALVLFVFAQYYQMHPDARLLNEFYHTMIAPMANFMASYVDDTTGLPKPSYDLWEEVFLTSTYTTAVVHAALLAAADLAEEAKDPDSAVKWRSAAGDMLQAAHKYLYDEEKKLLYKGVMIKDKQVTHNDTIDMSSFFGAFMFGLFPLHDIELRNMADTIARTFELSDDKRGLPRYQDDHYNRVSTKVTGNWWFITSLWWAQYCLEVGRGDEAKKTMDWVAKHADSTGVLSEQIDPLTDTLLSVAPLTWSHAEYVATLLDTVTEKPA